jgi:methylmalonyl-CoA/ethylmalonyl-CoA epimerase
MKPLCIDHIGIAVPNLSDACALWKALGFECEHRESVADQQLVTAMFPIGESRLELLEPTSPDSTIAKFLEKKGPGIHHLAFRVADLNAALSELKARGFTLIDAAPRIGAGGQLIAFLHPKSTNGLLIELCQPVCP